MKTMNDIYRDGSEHLVCENCGFCVTCGDCKTHGCRKRSFTKNKKLK